ncbi:MAG: LysM peptidoglycan-binding domain-containing protein [Anaerolineae bacterium]|nr:LysM peptidoglycan-binding domain-containing protein [Anaerolineae bacterium]
MKRLLSSFILLVLCASLVAPVQGQDAVSDLLGRINNLRAQLGLAPYSLNAALSAAAQNQANWMAANSAVSHVQDNGSRPRDRAQAAGYNSGWVSENIYIGGLATVDAAWNFWINSPVHYAGLTSPNYQDIGIATANGAGGHSFVLVFGTMSWGGVSSQNASASSGNGGGGGGQSAAAAPPSFIVGWDAHGNIMHEVQPGDTLGDIALLYGYTWDDIPTMLELNGLSEADIRALAVGSVFLVPPQSGTYTPTPADPEATSEATEPAPESTAEISSESQMEAAGILPTPEATEESAAADGLPPPAVFDAVTPSATMTNTATPTLTPTQEQVMATLPPMTEVAMVVETATPTTEAPPAPGNNPPLWLFAAIAVQLGVLGYASFEFFRRRG